MAWLAESTISQRELELLAKLVSTVPDADGYFLLKNVETMSGRPRNILSVNANHLLKKGYIERHGNGKCLLTEKGQALLKTLQFSVFDQINKYLQENSNESA